MDTPDPVLQQLRRLREGPGLTRARLEASGAVMSALGTSDPQEAYERLLAALVGLGSGERATSLAVDFGIDLPRHLGRPPSSREADWLGERRDGYGVVIGRSAKTLARWSDQTLAELRDGLITDTFFGHLVVMAAVRGDRILGYTVSRLTLDGAGQQEGQTQHIDNPTQQPSPPGFVYGFPRDWRPARLTFGVSFMVQPYPAQVWAVVADSFMAASFGEERYDLPLRQDVAVCRVERPRRDRLYGIWWR